MATVPDNGWLNHDPVVPFATRETFILKCGLAHTKVIFGFGALVVVLLRISVVGAAPAISPP